MLEDPARNPVQRLARRLLDEAGSCPALIHRSDDLSKTTKCRSGRSFPAMALLSDPTLDIRQYLEDLVTVAVGSAQQAEGMLIEARKANRKARRRIAVFASFGALGLVVGIAGLAASRSANVRLSEIRDEVGTLQKLRQDIASLQQQWKAEEAAFARQQAAREALLQQIADLQQQAASLRDPVARGSPDVNTEIDEPSQTVEALRPAQEASVVDNPGGREARHHKSINLSQSDTSLQDPVARRDVTDALQLTVVSGSIAVPVTAPGRRAVAVFGTGHRDHDAAHPVGKPLARRAELRAMALSRGAQAVQTQFGLFAADDARELGGEPGNLFAIGRRRVAQEVGRDPGEHGFEQRHRRRVEPRMRVDVHADMTLPHLRAHVGTERAHDGLAVHERIRLNLIGRAPEPILPEVGGPFLNGLAGVRR